jgi:hypothetical protein
MVVFIGVGGGVKNARLLHVRKLLAGNFPSAQYVVQAEAGWGGVGVRSVYCTPVQAAVINAHTSLSPVNQHTHASRKFRVVTVTPVTHCNDVTLATTVRN